MSDEDDPEHWHSRIRVNYDYMVDKLDRLDSVMDILLSRNVFTSHDIDFVKRGDPDGTQRAQNRRFLKVILSNGEEACCVFVEALKETKNPHIVSMLEKTDASELDALDDDDFLPSCAAGTTTPTEQRTELQGLSPNDVIVTLLLEILTNSSCPEEQPLFTLEQEICSRLRKVTKHQIPNFQAFARITFRDFLAKNSSRFSVRDVNDKKMVSVKKIKKKGKKSKKSKPQESNLAENISGTMGFETTRDLSAKHMELENRNENDELDYQEWNPVRSKKRSKSARPGSGKAQILLAEGAVVSGSSLDSPEDIGQERTHLSVEEECVRHFLNQLPGDNLLFRRSVDTYARDRVQFTLDVVSIWNTPNRDRGHIVLGVEANTNLPHALIGLPTSRDEMYFKDLFQGHLFERLLPQFSYREVVYQERRVGILQIEVSCGCGFPCFATNNDMALKVQKNQLWVRSKGSNTLVEPSDLFVGNIYSWFLGDGTPGKEVSLPEPISLESPILSTKAVSESAPCASSACSQDSSIHRLMMSLNHFRKGHFVLICGSLTTTCRTLSSLAKAPWIAVYDFDFLGRECGLLSILEQDLKKKRSLKVNTWLDHCTGLTELGTQWWSLMGRHDVSMSRTPTSHREWFCKVLDTVEKLCQELARYNEDYTVLTFLLLWPGSEMEANCIQKFLCKVHEKMLPRLIVFADAGVDITKCKAAEMIDYEYGADVEVFRGDLEQFCSELQLLSQDTGRPDTFQYKLPADDTNIAVFTDEDAAWLKLDLEVMYLENPYSKQKLSMADLKTEAEHFFRGGTIRWHTWYSMGSGFLDVERNISKHMAKHIEENYIMKYKSGHVKLFHAPGSGGSTTAQRVIWDLHEKAPCAKVKQRSGSPPEDIAEKLHFLHQRSRLPVVALFDGEDEPRLKQILAFLHRCPVVVVQLRRYLQHLTASCLPEAPTDTKYFLSGYVTKQESANLALRFSAHSETDQEKMRKLEKLDRDVQEDKKHQLFEYGMTVFAHEFHGVRAYVKGYLDLPLFSCKELKAWQECLGYIALVYFYGQMSIPCQFFARIMGKSPNYVMNLEDFPDQFQVLVIEDVNEARRGYLRISHHIIAREVLEQILNRGSCATESRQLGGNVLSKDAKHCLKDFCLKFIAQVTKKRSKSLSVTASTITYILAKTFIFRDNGDISDMDAQTTGIRKKPQFSPIMNDIDSSPPYNGRLEILEKLCETFPDDPNFRAHLGRFYSLCRPTEEEKAEAHFKKALELCYSQSLSRNPEELDERSRQTLMHIYHMFGNAYQRRIAKYTGWNAGDEPSDITTEANMEERLKEVINNATIACQYFLQARLHTTLGQEDHYTYMNDIHVRLQACDFANRSYPGGLQTFLSERIDTGADFVRESVTAIEDLIMECYNTVLLDSGTMIRMYLGWYCSLFTKTVTQLKEFVTGEDLTSLRLKVSRKKLKFRGPDNILAVEDPNIPAKAIHSIVNTLESIFQYQNSSRDMSKRMLDLYYKDWILAIRNPNVSKVYSLEQVLTHVRQWHEAVHSPQSTFYHFAVLSLLGFGTRDKPGSTEYLVEAEILHEETMQKISKTVVRPRYPREWVGRESVEGIRRLVTITSVGHVEDRSIKNGQSRAKLDVFKGTIRAKNKKLAGYIDLDLGENNASVMVFYIPLMADMIGSRYEGKRVQFYLAFTLDKGYEAFEVKPLERSSCPKCPRTAELTWIEQEIVCLCGGVILNKQSS